LCYEILFVIEFHGVLAMILQDTQSRARISFFLYLLFRHAISPLVSANCLLEVLPIVVTIICLCSSRCGEMIEQGRIADSNVIIAREKDKAEGLEIFL